jgi:hypothetical protein
MKWIVFLICFLLNLHANFGQELSVNIPITDLRSDAAIQVVELDENFLILGSSFCNDSILVHCTTLTYVDSQGNKLWNHVFDGSPDIDLRPNGWTMVVNDLGIFVGATISKQIENRTEVRIMAFDFDGNLQQQTDFYLPDMAFILTRRLYDYEDRLVLMGFCRQTWVNKQSVFILSVDYTLQEYEEHYFMSEGNLGGGAIDLFHQNDGNYALAYGQASPLDEVVLLKLNENLEVLSSKKVVEGFIGSQLNLFQTEDEGYILTWHKNLWFEDPNSYPAPSTVYKLDAEGNMEWEYAFASRYAKEHSHIYPSSDGFILGSGASDYFLQNDDMYPGSVLCGWAFKLDMQGNLIWDRTIFDNRNAFSGRFFHTIETDSHYLYVGDINMYNPTGVPFLNDPDAWFLTLSKDGCWNDVCAQVILITSDSTAQVIVGTEEVAALPEPDAELSLYPNPTSDVLVLEYDPAQDGSQERKALIYDLTGRLVMEIALRAPRSIINLRHLGAGTYLVQQVIDGRPVSAQKVVVAH